MSRRIFRRTQKKRACDVTQKEAAPVHLFLLGRSEGKKTIVCKVCVVFFPVENWEGGREPMQHRSVCFADDLLNACVYPGLPSICFQVFGCCAIYFRTNVPVGV